MGTQEKLQPGIEKDINKRREDAKRRRSWLLRYTLADGYFRSAISGKGMFRTLHFICSTYTE